MNLQSNFRLHFVSCVVLLQVVLLSSLKIMSASVSRPHMFNTSKVSLSIILLYDWTERVSTVVEITSLKRMYVTSHLTIL